jgi:hypothetical protein
MKYEQRENAARYGNSVRRISEAIMDSLSDSIMTFFPLGRKKNRTANDTRKMFY